MMQEIKLNEPFTLEGKMVKIVEVEQPKKERWFKCNRLDCYQGMIKDRLYKGSFIPELTTMPIERWIKDYPNDFEEIVPDFICQHSGEAFIKYIGTETKYFKAYHIDLGNLKAGIRNGNCGGDKNFAYFYTHEDALAWQESKFGKKEEEIVWWFNKETFEIKSRVKGVVLVRICPSEDFTSESDCIAARDKWIVDNVKINCQESFHIHKAYDGGGPSYEKRFVEYILNKGGK